MIYLDNAATTNISPSVATAMQNAMLEQYANPSAIYEIALANRAKIEKARKDIAQTLGVSAKEIYFTSGGSEADNWALRGLLGSNSNKRKHIITSKIEHKAILKTCEYLERQGYEITFLDVDGEGHILPDELERHITNNTLLVSIMFANNEIGTVMDIEELARITHKYGAYFHTDAVQVYGHSRVNCRKLGIDLLSASGHKFHGPKGIGFLYKREGIEIEPLIHGGSQESGLRAGTENVIGIMGMAEAAREAFTSLDETESKLVALRDELIEKIVTQVPESYLVGDKKNRNCNNICMCIKGVDALNLVDYLGNQGICISTGSACNMKDTLISHVLKAIKMDENDARSTIRISISKYSTDDEAKKFVDELVKAVIRLKQIY